MHERPIPDKRRSEAIVLPLSLLKILLVLPPLVAAFGFLGVSAFLVIRSRPLVVRSAVAAWFATLAVVPMLLAVAAILYEAPQAICGPPIFFLLLSVAMVALVWRRSGSYVAIGVSEDTFRAGLRAALDGLGLPFQETLLGFTLMPSRDTLEARVYPNLSTAYFGMRTGDGRNIAAQVAHGFREHLGQSSDATKWPALLYGGVGFLFLMLAFYQAMRY